MTDSDSDQSPVRSPCVSICKLGEDAYCVGCFRHSKEISYWSTYPEQEKQRIVEECKVRAKERLA